MKLTGLAVIGGFLLLSGCGGATMPEAGTDTGTPTDSTNSTPTFNAGSETTGSNLISYIVQTTEAYGGTITPASATVKAGDTVTFAVTPDEGFAITSVAGCPGTLNGNIFTTTPIVAPCTLSSSFQGDSATLTTMNGSGGVIQPEAADVAIGGSLVFTIKPKEGYSISSVTGCSGKRSGNNYIVNPVTSSCTVTTQYTHGGFSVAAKQVLHGRAEPTNQLVAAGGIASLHIVPDTGYEIDDVYGCGGTLAGDVFTTPGVVSNCEVVASFKQLADVIPDAFYFTAAVSVPRASRIQSNPAIVAGINAPAPISITGGKYSINGSLFVSSPATVRPGDSIIVRLTSSDQFSTSSTATVTISGVQSSFQVTTEIEDSTPDNLLFSSIPSIDIVTEALSNTVTLSGMNSSTGITVANGLVSINGGPFTDGSGVTVSNGDTVRVKHTSSANPNTDTQTTISIGDASAVFTSRTLDFNYGEITDFDITGIEFETSSGIHGRVDNLHRYRYKTGDTITFSVAGFNFPEISAASTLDYFTFTSTRIPTVDEIKAYITNAYYYSTNALNAVRPILGQATGSNPDTLMSREYIAIHNSQMPGIASINAMVLLQTYDSDFNPLNGIQINAANDEIYKSNNQLTDLVRYPQEIYQRIGDTLGSGSGVYVRDAVNAINNAVTNGWWPSGIFKIMLTHSTNDNLASTATQTNTIHANYCVPLTRSGNYVLLGSTTVFNDTFSVSLNTNGTMYKYRKELGTTTDPYTTYTYTAAGNISRVYNYSSNSSSVSYNNYTFDTHGRPITRAAYASSSTTNYFYEYDEEGYLSVVRLSSSSGTVHMQFVYEVTAYGKRPTQILMPASGSFNPETNFTYLGDAFSNMQQVQNFMGSISTLNYPFINFQADEYAGQFSINSSTYTIPTKVGSYPTKVEVYNSSTHALNQTYNYTYSPCDLLTPVEYVQ